MKPITEIVTQAEKLKPLPNTVVKLAQVIADEHSTIDDVTEIIRYDQALTADILKIANSAFSASNRSIDNIRDAVIRLGSARILEMVVSKKVKFIMKRGLDQYGYSENDLWRHSVASALAAGPFHC